MCLLVAPFNKCGRKPFGRNTDRPVPNRTFAMANMANVFIGERIARNPKGLWDSSPRKRAGDNP